MRVRFDRAEHQRRIRSAFDRVGAVTHAQPSAPCSPVRVCAPGDYAFLLADFDRDALQAEIAVGYHGADGNRGDARDAVENIEHELAGQVEDAEIDSDRCSDIAVRAADEWLQEADEREDLKRSNDDLVAIARDEDVILVDVDAWREAATARLLPGGDTAAAQARQVSQPAPRGGGPPPPWAHLEYLTLCAAFRPQ